MGATVMYSISTNSFRVFMSGSSTVGHACRRIVHSLIRSGVGLTEDRGLMPAKKEMARSGHHICSCCCGHH